MAASPFRHFVNHLHLTITGVRPPSGFYPSLATASVIITLSTIAYHFIEGWSYFDSFYFSVITITTVGYGDMHPTTVSSKIITILLLFSGVGIGLYILSSFSRSLIRGRANRRNC